MIQALGFPLATSNCKDTAAVVMYMSASCHLMIYIIRTLSIISNALPHYVRNLMFASYA